MVHETELRGCSILNVTPLSVGPDLEPQMLMLLMLMTNKTQFRKVLLNQHVYYCVICHVAQY